MIDPLFFNSGIFPLLFLLITAFIIFKIAKGILEWHHNNQQPILTVNSKVVSKRTKTSRRSHKHHHVTTDYYATFEVESGDRLELLLTGREYGQITEGDVGRLTVQGTRYHDFHRV